MPYFFFFFKEDNIPDEGVDLDGVNIVQLLQGLLDLALVCLDIHNEDEGVVLLDLLHGALRVERVQDDLGGIEGGLAGNRHTGVLGRPRELEGLGAVEGGRGADLAGLVKLIGESRLVFCPSEIGILKTTYRRALRNCLGGSVSPAAGLACHRNSSQSFCRAQCGSWGMRFDVDGDVFFEEERESIWRQ